MKILLIQEKGRHPQNRLFREALNMQRAFAPLGVETVVWGLGYDNFSTPFEEIEKGCDAIFLMENYEINTWIPDLSRQSKLKIFWSIDSHLVRRQHVRLCKRHRIDVVLNAIESHQRYFKGCRTYWFPNAYPDDLIQPMPDIPKIHNIGFCGNYGNRKRWIKTLQKKLNLKADIFVIGEDMVRAVNSYKIHFNRNIADDVNCRTFETPGCRTVLLTNHTENLERLFDLENHLVVYHNIRDLLDRYHALIHDTDRLERIAKNGYEHVRAHHTYLNRTRTLLDIIQEQM